MESLSTGKKKLRDCSRGWAALPESYRIPDVAPTLDEARAWCQRLAETHYENFHVARGSCPRRCVRIFTPSTPTAESPTILAMRWAAAEALGAAGSLGRRTGCVLRGTGAASGVCGAGGDDSRVLDSERAVCRSADGFPPGPDGDALRDHGRRAQYCRYSANPVGRLVLYACGEADEEKFRLSDATCSACNWPISGRMCAKTGRAGACICRRRTWSSSG
jgi:hypothetical protein